MSGTYEFDSAPTPEEAEKLVKRMSAGTNFPDQTNGGNTTTNTKDDKVLKIATFSLQKYLKVYNDKSVVFF